MCQNINIPGYFSRKLWSYSVIFKYATEIGFCNSTQCIHYLKSIKIIIKTKYTAFFLTGKCKHALQKRHLCGAYLQEESKAETWSSSACVCVAPVLTVSVQQQPKLSRPTWWAKLLQHLSVFLFPLRSN